MKYRIAVYTNDTRFYFNLLNKIRGTNVKASFFTLNQPPPRNNFDLLITTENLSSYNLEIPIMHTNSEEIDEDFIPRIISYAARKNIPKFMRLVIGVDPGKEIGLAVICDGMLLIAETCDLKKLRNSIKRYVLTFPSKEVIFRIGNQPNSISEVIFNRIFQLFKDDERVSFEIVQEAFSSAPRGVEFQSLSSDELAAYKIGQRTGKELNQPIETNIPFGRVKEIKKWSREMSSNTITLDTKLAISVALGEIAISDAINIKKREIEEKKE